MEKKPKPKTPQANPKSRRQMWQAYQHIIKAHEYFKNCWKIIALENRGQTDIDRTIEKYYNEAMVETWAIKRHMERTCKRVFNCDIEKLEVYK